MMNGTTEIPRVDRDHAVFINCPPGHGHWKLWEAVTLAVTAVGLRPLGDLKPFDPNKPTIDRVCDYISHSRTSIHDCSQCIEEKDAARERGRFNMPIEVGMALLERSKTVHKDGSRHQLLLLIPKKHPYCELMYNIAGSEHLPYNLEIKVLEEVIRWLDKRVDCPVRPKPGDIKPIWSSLGRAWRIRRASTRDMDELYWLMLEKCKGESWWKDPEWLVGLNTFDVFLAHNSEDKEEVRKIAALLRREGLNPWLDVEQIRPGNPFGSDIEEAIPRCKTAAVFFGRHGVGRWHRAELQVLLNRSIEDDKPVIPVLLPGADAETVSSFLRIFRWVKFSRIEDSMALDELKWAITGNR